MVSLTVKIISMENVFLRHESLNESKAEVVKCSSRKMKFLVFSVYLAALVHLLCCIKLTDVTVELFHSKAGGIVAAFGDFNADKMTDIFVMDDQGMGTIGRLCLCHVMVSTARGQIQ